MVQSLEALGSVLDRFTDFHPELLSTRVQSTIEIGGAMMRFAGYGSEIHRSGRDRMKGNGLVGSMLMKVFVR